MNNWQAQNYILKWMAISNMNNFSTALATKFEISLNIMSSLNNFY